MKYLGEGDLPDVHQVLLDVDLGYRLHTHTLMNPSLLSKPHTALAAAVTFFTALSFAEVCTV